MSNAEVAPAVSEFTIELIRVSDYRFEARFDDPNIPALLTDETPPLGANTGPSPVRLLAVAVTNCLAASLLFALRKFKNEPASMRATGTVSMVRNADNRLRVGRIAVDLKLGSSAAAIVQLDRILGQFEEFCVVTQSVRQAIPVAVRVLDDTDTVLHSS